MCGRPRSVSAPWQAPSPGAGHPQPPASSSHPASFRPQRASSACGQCSSQVISGCFFPGRPQPHQTLLLEGMEALVLLLLFFFFVNFWLHWVFVAAHGLSLAAATWGYSSLQSVGSRQAGLVAPRHVGSSRTRDQIHTPCVGSTES